MFFNIFELFFHSLNSFIQLREVDGDRTALIHLVTNLMKRLPLGQEVVIPADLARCIQDFTIEEEGISLRL